MKNFISSTAFMVIAAILIAYSGSVRSSTDNTKLETIARTHFIVLIRDTGYMKKKHYPRKMIVPTLPKLLFQGEKALGYKKPLEPPLPVYHPNHDHLSVVFVAIHKDGEPQTRCKNAPALSALPQHIFQWQPVEQGQNQATFTKSLKRWLKQDCRVQGHVSSSVLAEMMILPYVQSKLADEEPGSLQFSRTILIMLDNDAYYGSTIPSTELAELEEQEKIRDIKAAARLVNAVNGTFHIKTYGDWVFTIHPRNRQFDHGNVRHGNTLRYRLAEVQPLDANVDKYLDYHKEIRLSRIAISNDKLQLVQPGGKNIVLRILPSERLRPDNIQLTFTNKSGDNWQIGQHQLPAEPARIDLAACLKSGKCELQGDNIYIPLLSVAVDDLYLTPADPLPTAGKIRFKVRFRYNAGEVYTHHYVDSDWKTIDIQPVKPVVIPRSLVFPMFFPKIVLDNNTLAEEYGSSYSQNGLTPEIARASIVAKREAYQTVLLVVLLIVILFLSYIFAYKRRFQPRLSFQPAKKIDIDFNEQPGAKLLVGTLLVKNEGRVPWFGRLLGNKDYPDYQVEFSMGYSNDLLMERGFSLSEGPSLGFKDSGESTILARKMKHRVSHETLIYIFLATDVITDFQPNQTVSAQQSVTFGGEDKDVPISVDMWRTSERVATEKIEFDLELIPEQAKPPRVTYQASSEEKLYFNKGKSVEIGTFSFESQAGHAFAYPFVGHFNLQSHKNNLPLPDNAITLVASGEKNIVVLPNETAKVNIIALCDGSVIPNPQPPSQDYTFDLSGEFAPESAHGPHQFTLYRDPARANIHLDIVQFHQIHRLHWQDSAYPILRVGEQDNLEAEGHLLELGILELQPSLIKFDEGTPKRTIFEIHVGNTGKAGNGWVKVNLKIDFELKPYVRGSLKFHKGYQIKDLIHISTSDYQGPFFERETITVNEGEALEKIIVQIDAASILRDIEGGRIDPDHGSIDATLEIDIQTDEGTHNNKPPCQHKLAIRAPLGLEKLPHRNWLCIDFGTSAIVAAIGTGDKPYFLPLQKLVSDYDPAQNIEDYDLGNAEHGTNFLPSQVVCNADLRNGDTQDNKIRKGYPEYQPASLKPGEPDFIELPASSRMLREQPERVIYSLKSWLAQPSETIPLPETVKFVDASDREVERNQLPLDKVVESGLAALAEAYITAIPLFHKGGQLILSHPNTFTPFHQEKLHGIAWRSLNQRLGIALPERVRLISESDAVAYHYCRQRMLENRRRTGKERLLVYDFGAGTLDLSLVHIRWSSEGTYPELWQVENRLGVPIAGNYIDSLLARLVDKLLRDESVLNPAIFEYQYPVVDRQLKGSPAEQNNHRSAISLLWQEIRQVKQGDLTYNKPAWDGQSPFRIRVGTGSAAAELVYYKGKPSETANEVNSNVEKPLLEVDDNYVYLNIPAESVHNYLQEFIEFVTATVIDELLQGAGKKVEDINTVVVSGRGALWPQLRQRVWDTFPSPCEKPDLMKGNQVKSAVVSGAIAWQELSRQIKPFEPQITPQLAILLENNQLIIPEKDWEKGPIDLSSTSIFRLVQVSHRHPDPQKDFKSLRRYFYIRLAKLYREYGWDNDPYLRVHRETHNGKTTVTLGNTKETLFNFTTVGSISRVSSMPPWPIGTILLEPNE